MTGLTSITPRRAIPQILDALQAKESVMLWGPPGCAKSDIARQIAAMAFDGNLIDIRLAQIEPADLHLPVPNMEDRLIDWFPSGRLPNEKRHGKRGILLLDEITSAPPANAAVGYQLCLDRAVGDTPVPEEWGIMAAGNRQGDRGITYAMASPLANRFQHFEFNPAAPDQRAEWVQDFAYYCANNNVNAIVSAFIQFCPDLLYQAPKPGEVAFPTLRSWTKLAAALDRAEARNERIEQETAIGRVGNAAAQSFLAFLAHKDKVPTFAEIVANPEGARCPSVKELGACFFVVGMLGKNMSANNFAACSKYLNRLPTEIDAAAVGMLNDKSRNEILMTRSGQDWLLRVQDMLA